MENYIVEVGMHFPAGSPDSAESYNHFKSLLPEQGLTDNFEEEVKNGAILTSWQLRRIHHCNSIDTPLILNGYLAARDTMLSSSIKIGWQTPKISKVEE